jgi:frataxin-like iron-binding protein CyaY
MRREKTQISKIRIAKGEITQTPWKSSKSSGMNLRIHSNKWKNLEEMDKFVDTIDHQTLNQEDIIHLNKSMTQNESEAAIESPKKEKSRT